MVQPAIKISVAPPVVPTPKQRLELGDMAIEKLHTVAVAMKPQGPIQAKLCLQIAVGLWLKQISDGTARALPEDFDVVEPYAAGCWSFKRRGAYTMSTRSN
jgi:hypothetical protein